jgi:hypothetical protein
MSRAVAKRKALRDVTDPSVESPSEDMRLALPAAAKKNRSAPLARNQKAPARVAAEEAAPSPVEMVELPSSSPVVAAAPPSPDGQGFARPVRPAPRLTHRRPQVSEEILRMQEEQVGEQFSQLLSFFSFSSEPADPAGALCAAGAHHHGAAGRRQPQRRPAAVLAH